MTQGSFLQRACECRAPPDEWLLLVAMYMQLVAMVTFWVDMVEHSPHGAVHAIRICIRPVANELTRLEELMTDAIPFYDNQEGCAPCQMFTRTIAELVFHTSNHWTSVLSAHSAVLPHDLLAQLTDMHIAVQLLPSARLTSL